MIREIEVMSENQRQSKVRNFFFLKRRGRISLLKSSPGSSLNCKEIKPVNPKGNQSWIFIGRTDAEAPKFWLPDVKNWLIGKRPWCWERLKAGGEGDAGKGWTQEEKGKTEDEMVGWHHWLDGHEFEQTLGVGDGQEAWCAVVHGVTESDTTEQLNWGPPWWLSGKEVSAGDIGLTPDPGGSQMLWSNKACSPQILSWHSRAWKQQLLSPHAVITEACAPRAHAARR